MTRRRANRSRESYVSKDPAKRAAQLGNLADAPPPPPEGNTRHLMHGAFSERAVAPHQRIWDEAIYSLLEADMPVLAADGSVPAADRVIVAMLSKTMARLSLVQAWLDLHGPLDEKGRPRPAVAVESALRAEANKYGELLGMSPKSRAGVYSQLAAGGHDEAAARMLEKVNEQQTQDLSLLSDAELETLVQLTAKTQGHIEAADIVELGPGDVEAVDDNEVSA